MADKKLYTVEKESIKGSDLVMSVARNSNGEYIGDPKRAEEICGKRAIDPQTIRPGHTCCFGKSAKDGKWYGWSHRGICGFKVGDTVKKGHVTAEYLPVGFKAESDIQAMMMAVAYAESVA